MRFCASQVSCDRISTLAWAFGDVSRKPFNRSVRPFAIRVSALTTFEVSTKRKRVCGDCATRKTSPQLSEVVVDKMREIAATRQSALPRRSEATASRRSSASMRPKTTWVKMIAPNNKHTNCPVRVRGHRRRVNGRRFVFGLLISGYPFRCIHFGSFIFRSPRR